MNNNDKRLPAQNAHSARSADFLSRIASSAILVFLSISSPVTAGTLGDYAIFAGHQVTFTSSMNVFNAPLGRVGSNGDISFDSGTVRMTNVEAAGSMLGNPSFLDVQNNLVFNGTIQFGGLTNIAGNVDVGGAAAVNSTIQGNLTALGDVTIGGTVNGNVASNGSVTLSTFGTVGHNVFANQNLSLGSSTTVSGNVTYGNQLTLGTFATIGGTQTHGITLINQAHYIPVPIVPDSFVTGGADINSNFQTTPIAPGHYGKLSIAGGTIKLSPGQYFFDSVIATSSFMALDLDLSKPGNLEIFVKGNYDIPLQVVSVDGVDAASVDPQLARRVFLESLGNIHIGWDNLGTLFAPSGDISLDSLTDVWGATIAGHDAVFGGGDHLDLIPSNHFAVPEPTGATLLIVAGLSLGGWWAIVRRRRQRA